MSWADNDWCVLVYHEPNDVNEIINTYSNWSIYIPNYFRNGKYRLSSIDTVVVMMSSKNTFNKNSLCISSASNLEMLQISIVWII